jgi:hypothetical protein
MPHREQETAPDKYDGSPISISRVKANTSHRQTLFSTGPGLNQAGGIYVFFPFFHTAGKFF